MILQQLLVNDEQLCGSSTATSINGQCLPKITVTEGELHHWRLIHAGISETIDLAIENPSDPAKRIRLYEYAKDGINMGKLYPHNDIVLQPGYRSDILVQIPLLTDICPRQSTCTLDLIDAASTEDNSFKGVTEPRTVIATITINQGSGIAAPFPSMTDVHWEKPYSEISQQELEDSGQPVQQIWFTNEVDGSKSVNGDVFPAGDAVKLTLNKAQTWKVWVGKNQASSDKQNHPFHIHVNPFEVIKRNEKGEIIERFWKDTVLISAVYNRENNPVELRSRYENFSGKFVLHCHNLNHEDAGMMKTVEINP